MKYVYALFLALLLPGISLAAEKGSYRTFLKKTGEVLWQARWESSSVQKNGREIVTIIEDGQGRYASSSGAIRWVMKASYACGTPAQVIETDRTAYGAKDRQIWRKRKVFDYAGRKLIAEKFEGSKLAGRKVVRMPAGGGVLTSETLPVLLGGSDYRDRKPRFFSMFTSEGGLYRIRVRRTGVERVRVPAGQFTCNKIELSWDMGLASVLARSLLPKTYLWFTAAPPYHWVKFEGLERGIGSAFVVMELLERSS